MDSLLITLLLFTFIVCILLAWYFSHKARTKERLILIEKVLTRMFFSGKKKALVSRGSGSVC
jgi:hypothetical protein